MIGTQTGSWGHSLAETKVDGRGQLMLFVALSRWFSPPPFPFPQFSRAHFLSLLSQPRRPTTTSPVRSDVKSLSLLLPSPPLPSLAIWRNYLLLPSSYFSRLLFNTPCAVTVPTTTLCNLFPSTFAAVWFCPTNPDRSHPRHLIVTKFSPQTSIFYRRPPFPPL